MHYSKWQWTREPARQADTIPWYFVVSLGLFCGTVAAQVFLMSYAPHARYELQAAREKVQARTLTLGPQERLLITLGEGGYTFTTPTYGHYAVMDPSCQVHRQQEPPPSQVREWNEGAQRVLTYNPGTQVWTIPGSGNGGEGRVVWRGEPRVLTHNGVVSAVVTNESIVALPENDKDEANSVKRSHH